MTVGAFTIQHLPRIVNVLRISAEEVSDIYELFRGKIAEQKKIRRLTDADIAKMTGYTTSTIRAFMCGSRENEKIATAIAQALGIER